MVCDLEQPEDADGQPRQHQSRIFFSDGGDMAYMMDVSVIDY